MFLNGDELKNTAWDKSEEKPVNVFPKQNRTKNLIGGVKEKFNEMSTDIEDKVNEMSNEIEDKDKKINDMSTEIDEMSTDIEDKDKKINDMSTEIQDKEKKINEFDNQNEINESNKQTTDEIISILQNYNEELGKIPSKTLRYQDFENILAKAQEKIIKCIGMICENNNDVFKNLISAMRMARRDLDKVTEKAQQQYLRLDEWTRERWTDWDKEKDQIQKIVKHLCGSALRLNVVIAGSMPKKIGNNEELNSTNSSESSSENYSSLINTADL